MKILYLYMFPLWGNGSGTWLRYLTKELKNSYGENFSSVILAPESRKLKFSKVIKLNLPTSGVFVGNPEMPDATRYFDLSTQDHVKIFNYYLTETVKVVEKYKPDLVHCFHTAFLPPVARMILNFYHIPYIITTHGSDLYYFKEDPRWKSLMRDASERAKYITANSNFTRSWYATMFGKDLSRKLRTIPAGVNLNIDFDRDVSWIDKKYNFKYEKMVLFTGRLTEQKGVSYLIEAAKKIKAEIVILGDGPRRGFLEKLVAKHELSNVHMLGYFSHRIGKISDFYLRADVYVAPSVWQEPLGMVILESMAHKTPVIATRKGGVTSIVKDGVNGYLVRAKDSKVLAGKVNLLLSDDAKRERMGENAYKSVAERFSWEKIASKFYNMYERIINSKKKMYVHNSNGSRNKS